MGRARSQSGQRVSITTRIAPKSSSDREAARIIVRWFASAQRDLPWRRPVRGGAGPGRRDPYASLVAEMMLQQTQVSRVLERFSPFLLKYPTIRGLARAGEQDVLASWAGMGYYRRARHLHEGAKAIVARFGGAVPSRIVDLLSLPGIGRYSAGAISSIVFGHRAPVVDGNVRRVLQRIEGRLRAPDSWAWRRAAQLVMATDRPGALNEGLMELGATVCTPRGPRCDRCPLSRLCSANLRGITGRIPAPRARPARQTEFHSVVVVRDPRGRVLVEQRPRDGRWAGMWQAPTVERRDRAATAAVLHRALGVTDLSRGDRFDHATTQALICFEVWDGLVTKKFSPVRGEWVSHRKLCALPMSNAQRRVLLGSL